MPDDLRLPSDAEFVRVSPEFDETSVPPGLLRAHRVAPGVWGRLVVRDGRLRFLFEDAATHPRMLIAGDAQVIPPDRLHHVEFDGPVRFVVEFHRDTGGTVPT